MTKTKKQKHVPRRMCIACRQEGEKRLLVRLVRSPDGVVIDPTGKVSGRGAYLHNLPTCWQKALAHNMVARALNTTLTPADVEILEAYGQRLAQESADETAADEITGE